MSLMERVEQAMSRLKSTNEQLTGARNSCNYRSRGDAIACGVNNQINRLKEKLLELPGDVIKGAGEAVKDELSGLWDAVTNPIETAKDSWAGLQEAVDDPIGAAKEAWNDFTEPYVEDWENGLQGEAIGRGLVEGGQLAIPGWGFIKGGKKALDILEGLGKDGDAPETPNDPDGSDGGEPEDTPSVDGSETDNDDGSAEGGTEIRPGSDEDLLEGATPTEGGSKTVDNRVKPGGFDQANKEFDQYTEGREVKDQGGGIRSATLPDGRTVSVRPDSQTGGPTIQISPPRGTKGGITTKIRYTD